MSQAEYEDVREFWEEWKRSNRPRTDPDEARRLSMMTNLFLATAGLKCEEVDQPALAFIRENLGNWRADLGGDEGANQVLLYRGLVDEHAVAARSPNGYVPPVGIPVSFAYDVGAALGFARRGHIDGVVISVAVDLRDVDFSDRKGLYREGNAHKEAEVVVVFSNPPDVSVESLRVPPAKRPHANKTARERWQQEVDRLISLEGETSPSSEASGDLT
jgi:hypothetical protein